MTVICLSLFTDGLSTTTPTILFNLYCLATWPAVQQRVYDEIVEQVVIMVMMLLKAIIMMVIMMVIMMIMMMMNLYCLATRPSVMIQGDISGVRRSANHNRHSRQVLFFCTIYQ